MTKKIYLDNAATTQLSPEVFNDMMPYLSTQFGNPSSVHAFGREARLAVERSRKTVAGLLGVRPSTITFTGSGTEANNMAILSAARTGSIKHIITSSVEHHAVLHPVERTGLPFSVLTSDHNGRPSIDQLELHLMKIKGSCFVSLMAANNETGALTDINYAAKICQKHEAIYHTDAVQYIGHYPMDLGAMPVHFASASGHKFHGPKGTGILYTKEGTPLKALFEGGGQEKGIRSGTENVAGIVGFARALEIATRDYERNRQHILNLRTQLKTTIKEVCPNAVINEDLREESLYSVLSVSFPVKDSGEDLVLRLDSNGIAVSGGSACTVGAVSHVMRAIGKGQGYETVRFSFSVFNTPVEIKNVISILKNIMQKEV